MALRTTGITSLPFDAEGTMARIAFIRDERFEDSEFKVPYDGLRQAGHDVAVIGREAGKQLKGKQGKESTTTELAIAQVDARDYDALVIPGGYSPDKLRTDSKMVRFTREMVEASKPVAAICHAGSMLVEADVARGRTLTSWPSIKTDLVNAGARWVDREVVEDGNLITSRKPADLPAFVTAIRRHLEQAQRAPAATPQNQSGVRS
jgi:protease I